VENEAHTAADKSELGVRRMKNEAKATLVKLATDDGLCFVREGIEIGTRYTVCLSSISDILWGQWGTNIQTERRSAVVVGENGNVGWLPLEFLKLDIDA
jgi:hypothetical protein